MDTAELILDSFISAGYDIYILKWYEAGTAGYMDIGNTSLKHETYKLTILSPFVS